MTNSEATKSNDGSEILLNFSISRKEYQVMHIQNKAGFFYTILGKISKSTPKGKGILIYEMIFKTHMLNQQPISIKKVTTPVTKGNLIDIPIEMHLFSEGDSNNAITIADGLYLEPKCTLDITIDFKPDFVQNDSGLRLLCCTKACKSVVVN